MISCSSQPPLESPWTMHMTNFYLSRGYKKANVGSIASFFRDTEGCPRICLWRSGKKFERLWRTKALALFCQDLCFLNSFIPKPITSLLLKKKKNPQCISHHILCPQLPLCLCISSLAPDPVGSGESSSQGSAVWGARGC